MSLLSWHHVSPAINKARLPSQWSHSRRRGLLLILTQGSWWIVIPRVSWSDVCMYFRRLRGRLGLTYHCICHIGKTRAHRMARDSGTAGSTLQQGRDASASCTTKWAFFIMEDSAPGSGLTRITRLFGLVDASWAAGPVLRLLTPSIPAAKASLTRKAARLWCKDPDNTARPSSYIWKRNVSWQATYTMSRNFGESVSPVAAIQAILHDYPFSASILRELLQNSDDAKATKQVCASSLRKHMLTKP